MKNRKITKKLLSFIILCTTVALCAFGISACADKPKTAAVTVEQLTEANDRHKIIEKYGNLHVTETTTYESGATYTANALFYANDYGLVMDYLDEKSDGSKYYSTTMMDGMMLVFNKDANDKRYNADIYADGEYDAKISSIYNLQKSDVIKAPEVKDGKIVVETEYEYPLLNYSEKKTFYFNAETLLIERATTQYTVTTSASIGTTTNEVTYEYGCSDYTPALTAYNAHKNAENKSSFIVVRNAGTAGEKRIEYTLSGESALVVFNGEEKEYALYADADCTIEVENYKDYAKEGYVPVFYLAEKTVPTLKQVIEANDKQKVVEKYGNAHISETASTEGGEPDSTLNMFFYANNYGLVADYLSETTDGTVYYSVTAIDGLMYVNNKTSKGVEYKINVIASDYNAFVASKGNIDESEVIKAPEVKDGKIVVETAYEFTSSDNSYSYTKTYYCNIQTLLIESYATHYTIVSGTEEEKGYTNATVVYGADYTPTMTAYNAHKNADDSKDITIIRNGKTDSEERTQHTVSLSSQIKVLSEDEKQYALFENVSCTNEIDDINAFITDNAYPTIYLGEAKTEAISFVYTYTQADYEEFSALLADFEAAALNEKESLYNVQIAYDYMCDKGMYIQAQSKIAYVEYVKDVTVASAWENYTTAYKAYLDSHSATREVYKRLYKAGAEYNSLLFKSWSQEQIDALLGEDSQTANKLNELYLDCDEIIKTLESLTKDETWIQEASKLYERLTTNNRQIAALNGFDDFYDYACKQIYNRDWSKEEITAFSDYVKKYISPLYTQMERRKWELGDSLSLEKYMQAVDLLAGTKYSEFETDYLSLYFATYGGSLGEKFNSLLSKDVAIFAEGENGSRTAFTGYMDYYGEPYCVFGSGDYYQSLQVVVHEAGHYASFYNFDLASMSRDLSETHSQANEFLFLTFLKDYFDEDIYEYCVVSKIENTLYRIILQTIINQFEIEVYGAETPYTADDYAGIIARLCSDYGVEELKDYITQYVLNVTTANPVYYISYGVSYVACLDLYITAIDDYAAAQKSYRILQDEAKGSDGFKGALSLAGIGSPFEESTFIKINKAFDYDTAFYNAAVEDAMIAEESEIRDLVTLTTDDSRVSWNEDGKVLLLTFHKYPDSYVEGSTFTTGDWYMWTVTDGEIIEWYKNNWGALSDRSVELKQLLGMPLSSTNCYISAVWVDVADVIRPAYQTDPTKQLTAKDLDGSSLGEYADWFNSNILSSYFSSWGQYPWTRLGYTYDWGSDDEYGLTEFLVLKNSTIEVEFTKTIDEFFDWLYDMAMKGEEDEEAQAA